MICPNCGQTTTDLETCTHCGAALNGPDTETGAGWSSELSAPSEPSDYIPFRTGSGVMNIFGVESVSAPHPAAIAPSTSLSPSLSPSSIGHLIVHFDADDWGSAAEHVVPLTGQEVTVGRSPGCTITLDQDILVSRQHAVIRHYDAGYAIVDLGSSNGTLLNGSPLVEEYLLRDGDVIRIGDCEIIYSTAPAQAAAVSAYWDLAANSPDTIDAEPKGPTPARVTVPQTVAVDDERAAAHESFSDAAEGPNGSHPGMANSISSAETLASAPGQMNSSWADGASAAASPPALDLDVLQTRLTDMVSQLRQQADASYQQVTRIKAEVGAVTAALAALIETERQLAIGGPDLSALIQVTERTVESPRHLDNVVEFASHAAEIGAALQALAAIRSSSGLVPAIDSLRARLAALD